MTRKIYRFGAATVWLALAFAAALPAQGQSTLVILDRDSTFDTDGTFDNAIYQKFYYDPAAAVPNDLAAALEEAREEGIDNIIVVGREDGGVYPDRFRFAEDDVFTIQGFPGETPSSTVIRADDSGPAIDAAEAGVDVTVGNMTLLSVEVGDTVRGENTMATPIPAATVFPAGNSATLDLTGNTTVIRDLNLRFTLSGNATPTDLTMTLTHTPTVGTPLTIDVLAGGDIALASVTDIEIDDESDRFLPDQVGTYAPGRYRSPNDRLSAFDGRTLAGTWELTVNAAVTVTDWSLITASATEIPIVPDAGDPAPLNVGIVTAELFLTHPEVSELEIYLISPGGTSARLASAPFVSGPNFGTAAAPTVFADAGLPLESGVAPYEGAFRPVEALIGFESETPARDEAWTLRILNSGSQTGSHNESALEITEVTRGANAVLVANSAELTMEICNVFLVDDGIRVEADSTLTMDRCFVRSTTDNGVIVTGANAVATSICNSLFAFNDGAAIRAADGAEATVSYATIMRNGVGVITSGSPDATLNIDSSLIYLNDGLGVDQEDGTINDSLNYVLGNSGNPGPPDEWHYPHPTNYSVGFTPDATSTVIFDNVTGGLVTVSTPDQDPSLLNPLVSTGVSELGVPGVILDFDSPLIDYLSNSTCGDLDFLGFPRNVDGNVDGTPGIDIGAFEFVDEETLQFAWYECRVKDVEVPREQYIGKADPGDVTIEIRTFSIPRSVFILPQGEILEPGNPNSNRIEFQYVSRSGRVSTWENVDDITTLLTERDGVPGLSIGDFIADGHGSVFLSFAETLGAETPDNIVGVDGAGDLSDGGLILDQALIGRHVIIDTIPPRPTAIPLLRAKDFVANGNDDIQPSDIIGAPTTQHPYPAAPTSFPTVGIWEPGVFDVPQDNGGIGLPAEGTGGTGGTVLFNHASISNRAAVGSPANPANNLRFDYIFAVTDDVVRDPIDPSIVLEAEDRFLVGSPLKARQPGGFFEGAAPVGQWQYLLGRGLSQAPGSEWGNILLRLVPGSDTLPNDTVVSLTGTASDPIAGWDVLNDSTVNYLSYTATVSFYDGITGTIPFLQAFTAGHLHLGVQFVGSDAAGNTTPFVDDPDTPGDDAKVLDPIHVWWMTDTAPRLAPERGGTRTRLEETSFTLGIDRGFSPTIVGQPRPAYTYRMWRAQTPGDSDAARNGLFVTDPGYAGLAGWRSWTQQNQIPPTYFRENAAGIAGNWVVLASAVIDEAGNVSPLDPNMGYDNLSNTVNAGALTRGVGWQKFFIDGSVTPDTQVAAFFWFDLYNALDPLLYEPNRPNAIGLTESAVAEGAGIVPSPPVAYELEHLRLNARFDFTIAPRGPIPPNGAGQLVRTGVVYELIREGDEANAIRDVVVFQPVGQGRTQGSVVIPPQAPSWFFPTNGPIATRLEDIFTRNGARKPQGQRQPIRYVLRAYGWVDLNNNGMPDDSELDSTPANLPFTVVPESNIGNYIDPKDSPDDQPIKVNEAR